MQVLKFAQAGNKTTAKSPAPSNEQDVQGSDTTMLNNVADVCYLKIFSVLFIRLFIAITLTLSVIIKVFPMSINRRVQTLDEFTIQSLREIPSATGELSRLLRDIGLASKRVNVEVNKAALLIYLEMQAV
jgi:hypothetical protein